MPTSATNRRKTTRSSSSEKTAAKKDAANLPSVDPSRSPLSGGIGFEIDKQVNLPQLQSEIEQATGLTSVNIALSATPEEDDPNNAVLWLTPAGINQNTLSQVVSAHVPNSMWGVPQIIQDFNQAVSRLREDPDGPLTDEDRDALVKGIALNFTALMPNPSG